MTVQTKVVPGFLPSTSGLHFTNRFPTGIPIETITIPVVNKDIPLGEAANGVCGGMVYAVLDSFLAAPRMQPPTTRSTPGGDSPITAYLIRRLKDSFALDQVVHSNVARYLTMMSTPDEDELFGAIDGVPSTIAGKEWPKIKADIDAGRPSPLGLVGGTWKVPGDAVGQVKQLGHCHQVLAYGYTLDDAHKLTLRVYDPNDPDDDGSVIQMSLANPSKKSPITTPQITSHIAGHGAFRAFFRHGYYSRATLPGGFSAGPVA
jgi:hypothetical protein